MMTSFFSSYFSVNFPFMDLISDSLNVINLKIGLWLYDVHSSWNHDVVVRTKPVP